LKFKLYRYSEVWAENTRDETMRAELESLFERAAEVGGCTT
jgi:hypothetical protein